MLSFLLTGCGGVSTPGEGYTEGPSTYDDYFITQNGDMNNESDLTTENLDTEYDTFLLLKDPKGQRDIFLGGLIDQLANASKVEIECSQLYNTNRRKYIKTLYAFGHTYYFVAFNILSYNSPTNATLYAKLLDNNNTTISQKQYTIKIAPENAKDWGLRVYQQQSYNRLDDTKDEVVSEFKKMGVFLGIDGVNIINVDHSLPDEVIDYDYNSIPIEDDPCVLYAFSKIYPNIIDPGERINQYFTDHPNEGLLFFVKDYNMLHPPLNPPIVFGYTINGAFANGEKKRAPISFIFIDQHTTGIDPLWIGKFIQTTVIHELGHLWCENFTDNSTHTFWHNSNDKIQCVMKSDLVIENQIPDQNAQRVLNFRSFCIGHLQRGSNISWHLKQYSPYGEESTFMGMSTLLASASKPNHSYNDDDIEVELTCDKTDLIQGESINIFLKIQNNTDDTITISSIKNSIYEYGNDSTFTNRRRGGIIIPPLGRYYDLFDPSDYLVFSGIDFSTNFLKPGIYKYNLSVLTEKNEVVSNTVRITINPVPNSLQKAFNDFGTNNNTPRTTETFEKLANKYKNSFYEQQFYFKLLISSDYYNAIRGKEGVAEYRNKAINLNKEFILKYPNSNLAYRLFNRIMRNYTQNQLLVEEVLTSLKHNQPECKLLEVLRNQPEYVNKQIIHLLY